MTLLALYLLVFVAASTIFWTILRGNIAAPATTGAAGPGVAAAGARRVLRAVSQGARRAPFIGEWMARQDTRFARLLRRAGHPGGLTTGEFLLLKLLLALGLPALLLSLGLPVLVVVLAVPAGLILPNVWLRRRLHRRLREITRQLPVAMDTLALTVCAGADFTRALDVFLEHFHHGALADELRQVRATVRLGRPRADALREMADLLECPGVTHFVTEIIHTEKTGGSLAEFLKKLSADLRERRLFEAERLAQTAPLRVVPALALLSMPCIFIAILAPVLINAFLQLR